MGLINMRYSSEQKMAINYITGYVIIRSTLVYVEDVEWNFNSVMKLIYKGLPLD